MCVCVARPRDSGPKDTYFTNPLIRPRPADTVRRTLKISARNWQIYRDPVVALRYSMYMSERKRLYSSSSVDRLQLHYLGVYSLLAPALGYYNATLYKRELSENERERERQLVANFPYIGPAQERLFRSLATTQYSI